MEAKAKEVLILDTNTFVEEIGLTSRSGSALKHYLYSRGTQLAVPELIAEECERNLTKRAREKRTRIEQDLQWLGRFCEGVSGWQGPSDETMTQRAKALARADHLGAVVVPETDEVLQRAEFRDQSELPPSQNKSQLADCRIWEQCLDLLTECHVVFVSADGDFRGYRDQDSLHPALRAEAEEVAGDRSLTFHKTMESLLSELGSEIQPMPDGVVFSFVYESIAADVEKLESNSGCHPKRAGKVKQTLLTTDQAEVIEVRLEIEDIWQSADKARTMDFRFSGSCHYRLAEEAPCDLTPSRVSLLTQQPDGSVRAVRGSYVSASASPIYFGAAPIQPGPAELRHA